MLCPQGQPYRQQRAGRGEVTGKEMMVAEQRVSGGAVRGRSPPEGTEPTLQDRRPRPLQPAGPAESGPFLPFLPHLLEKAANSLRWEWNSFR